MSHKSEAAYDAVLKYINEEIISLKCRAYMTDYELALRNAFAKVAPDADAGACQFHFAQANKRYLRRLKELVDFLESKGDDAKAGNELFNNLINLPLLPADQIKEMFILIKHKALALNHNAFKRYLNYFENQWIIKVSHFFTKREVLTKENVYRKDPKRSPYSIAFTDPPAQSKPSIVSWVKICRQKENFGPWCAHCDYRSKNGRIICS